MIKPQLAFCGLPVCANLADLKSGVAIFGSPLGTPYKAGTPSHAAGGATAVRAALAWYGAGKEQFDFDSMLPLFGGVEAVDCGDLDNDLYDGDGNRANIRQVTEHILTRNAVPVLLGGDDSVPIPFIEAYGSAGFEDITIVQVDAHIDWRHEVDGVTRGFCSTMRRASEMAHVRRMIQVGARGRGSARRQEYEDALAWGLSIVPARDIHAHGLGQVIDAIAEDADVILTVDVDGLDPGLIPGVVLPACGGLGYQQMLDLIYGVARKARIVGVDFVEFVSERDPTGSGAQAVARLVSNVIAAIGSADTTRP